MRQMPDLGSAVAWETLTQVPGKACLYEADLAFREGWQEACEVLQRDRAELLRRSALLLLKPDGLVAGRLGCALDFLAAHGFQLVALEMPKLTGHLWREMWRYQMTMATLDRVAVNDLILQGHSVLLGLKLCRESDVPASVLLTSLKGPSDVAKQQPDCLRRRMRQPNRMLSMFHVADEPADLVRELAILLAPGQRRAFLRHLLTGNALGAAQQDALAKDLRRFAQRPRDLCFGPPLQKLEAAILRSNKQAAESRAAQGRLAESMGRMRLGQPIDWRPFVQSLAGCGLRLGRWELAALGAQFVDPDEPGRTRQLEPVDVSAWLCRPEPRDRRPASPLQTSAASSTQP